MKNARPAENRNSLWHLAGALACLLAAAVVPRAAMASWGFTATLSLRGNCSGVIPPTLPPITGFSDDATCEAIRSQVLSIQETGGNCTVGYTCTPCTGTNSGGFGNIGGLSYGGGGISAGQSPLTAGSFAASVFAPLNNGVTAVNPFGADAGQATFSPHYSENSPLWQTEAGSRYQFFPGFFSQSPSIASVQYQNRFAQNISDFCDRGGCAGRGSFGAGAFTTTGPTYSQPDAPSVMSDDPSITGTLLPPISIDPAQAISIGGAGVTQQAAPDKQPAPNPEKPSQGNQCRKSWWYNSATKLCYGNSDSCQGDNSAGPHRCYPQ